MNDECGVFELQILAHKVAQIGQTRLGRRLFGVVIMADGVEQGGGLGVGTVLPHALNDAINGPIEAEQAMRTGGCLGHNHLLIAHHDACMTKTLLQGLFHFCLAFIEQSIMRKRQIPRIPMGFARDRVGE